MHGPENAYQIVSMIFEIWSIQMTLSRWLCLTRRICFWGKTVSWREDLSRGFAECFRVLKPGGVLIFKWNECDIPLREILKCAQHQPLFGHPSGKAQKTHWCAFMKPNELEGNGTGRHE